MDNKQEQTSCKSTLKKGAELGLSHVGYNFVPSLFFGG